MAQKPKAPSAGFEMNITKTDERDSFAWSTEKVNQLLLALDDGYKPRDTPFYENNPNLRKGNIVFNYTNEEIQELVKCSRDIIYFANTHCNVMTDEGVRKIKLRPYQEKMLNQFQNEQFNIVLASRQIGKCLLSSTKIKLIEGNSVVETTLGRLYFEQLKLRRNLTILESVKYFLWKLYEKLDEFDNVILNLIQAIEKFEYRHTDLDQDDVTKKIMDSLDLSDVMIDTDTGWERITHIHKTQPYNIIKIELENGMYLEGADLHIVFNKNYEEVFIKNLKIGDEIITRNGLSKVSHIINHETYVSMFDVTVQGKNHRYWSNDILSHNTICSSIYIVWYSLFNFDKNALILANVGKTTTEIIDKGKVIFENLPFYLKPGVLKWDVFNTKFDNGCRIIGQTTTKKSAIGFNIHLLFMDEFAHINPSFIDSFYENVYPTISASKVAKVIITSTPNGFNKFYDLYSEAVDGLNEYTPFRVDWWEVPGRDEAWMQREISNLGGEDAFNRQYGNLFVTGSSLLLQPSSILKIKENSTTFVHREIYELDDYDVDYSKLIWHPKYNIDAIKDDVFCIAIDIAEGGGGDYSILNVFKVEAFSHKEINKIQNPISIKDFFKLKQIALWRCNTTDIADFSKLIYYVTHVIMNIDNIKIILEWNTYGAEVLKNLEKFTDFDEESLIKFKHRLDAKFKSIGLKVTAGNKTIICTNFKKHISQNRIEILESKTVEETSTYGLKPNGTYGAQMGHDDTTATAIEATEIFATQDFEDLCEVAMDWLMENDVATYDLIDLKLENTNQDEEFLEAEFIC